MILSYFSSSTKLLQATSMIALFMLLVVSSSEGSFSIVESAMLLTALVCLGLSMLRSSNAVSMGGGEATKAIANARAVLSEIDQGNFEARINQVSSGETQGLYNSVNAAIDRTDAFVRESAAAMHYVSEKKYFRPIIETGMTGAFLKATKDINGSINNLASMQTAALELQDRVENVVDRVIENANKIVHEAENMGGKIDVSSSSTMDVAESANQTSESVTLVAAASEQLAASVREITQQVNFANQTAQNAMGNVDKIQVDIDVLSTEAKNIGEVISLISDIAAKTNLLALNATVEASRAGEAGKGFAVVAAEVKNLADQTSKATDRISSQIGNIQDATEGVVAKALDITRTINEINEVSSAIAAAVEEQGAATNDISEKVNVVAEQSRKVSDRIGDIAQASAGSYAGAISVIWAAGDQIEPVKELNMDLHKFFEMI